MHAPVKKLQALPAPQRVRSRRERRATAVRRPVVHVVMPGCEVARAEIKPRESIAAFLRRTGWATKDRTYGWQFKKGLPTVLEVNGESILRRHWHTRRIAANDNVRFVSFPLGGSGGSTTKQVVGLVALIAVSAFALWAPTALLGLTAGSFGALGATAAIGVGGSLLVNALVAPKAGATNDPNATQDQIYSVAAAGNTAKLGQPLPVWYGRLKDFPDFAATPWGEFVGNDQYLNVLLSVSMGSLSYEAITVDQTLFWDPVNGISATFTGDAQIAFYEPGDDVTLFPVNVDSSIEVTGQELPSGGGSVNGVFGSPSPGAPLGPFVANPSGTLAQSIAVDFVFPGGAYYTDNSDSQQLAHPLLFRLIGEYAPVDGAGALLGGFTTLFDVTRTYCSKSPIRDSVKVDVTPGRYTVRVSRGDAAGTQPPNVSDAIWAGMRSFLKGASSFPDVSTVAIRLLASQSTQGSFKFGVIATRKLPVWNGSAFVTQATRNNGWALLDAVTNAQYGSTLPISKVDFNTVVSFAAACDTRGDTFDYKFSTATAVPDAFDKILTPARSRHFWLGDTVSLVRDEFRDVPSMLLTDREIVRDSTQVTWTMLGDEDPDAVIVEYIDQDTWLPAQVQYPPDDLTFTAENAEVKRIDGIVDRDQAFRECAFYYLQSIYRRENVQIGVEYEGRAITFGSVLRVQSELPMAYGYGGAVVGVSVHALTLDPAPVWDTGPFYIRLRQADGTYFGPVVATMGANASIANLDATSLAAVETAQSTTLSAVLAREDGGEYPSFELGTGDSQSKLCVVLNGVPNGELCTLSLVVDDERVHATSLGSPPILPIGQFPSNASLPLIVGLNAQFGQGTAEPVLGASWFPAAGAVYYIADVSYDAGSTWQQVYQGEDNKLTAVVTLAALTLRVQAVTTKLHGPYATVSLAAPVIVISDNTVALESLIAGIKYQVTTLQDLLNDKIDQVNQLIASVVANQDTRNWLDKKELRSQLSATAGTALALVESVETVAVDTETAFASFSASATASFGSVSAFVSTSATAIATSAGIAASEYAVTLTVDGYASGFNLLNGGSGFSTFTIVADKFQVQLPTFNSGLPYPVFTTGLVGGVPSVGIHGNLIIDGTITGTMIQAGTVQAVNITTGTITSASGVIGALSLQSLSIADNAVTVIQEFSSSSVVQNTVVGVALDSPIVMSINTAGLAGKTIPIVIALNAQHGVGATGNGNWQLSLSANGTPIASAGGTTTVGFVALSAPFNITASGGTDTVTLTTLFSGAAADCFRIGSRTYSAVAGKR